LNYFKILAIDFVLDTSYILDLLSAISSISILVGFNDLLGEIKLVCFYSV